MMKKKIISMLLCATMGTLVAFVTGCGSDPASPSNSSQSNGENTEGTDDSVLSESS